MAILKRKSKIFRIICALLVILLIQNNLAQVQAQPTPFLPSPDYIDLSIPYSLPVLRGMRVYPDKPFEFDFIIDSRDRHTIDQKETSLLIKYFLTFLTIPEEDLWVNLSPYEAGKIIPDDMALTNAGNTLLEQDKLLKQLSSSLTYPETSLGKKFWEKVYKIASERYGTTNLPINTYNKVWIVPDRAIIYDMGNSALVGDTHFKVMLEEDYLALKRNMVKADRGGRALHTLTSEITKEIILPELEKEINTGKNFAPVRQMFHSLVLADWFKQELRRNILSEVYVNKKKISGVDGVDKDAKEKIYKQYLHIFKVGAYNYIREDVDPITNQMVSRKYFSGGCSLAGFNNWGRTLRVFKPEVLDTEYFPKYTGSNFAMASVRLKPIGFNPMGDQYNLAQLAGLTALAVEGSEAPMGHGDITQFYRASGQKVPQQAAAQGNALTPKAFNYLLELIVEGKSKLTDPVVEASVTNSIMAFLKSGKGSIVQNRIAYYENLLTPTAARAHLDPSLFVKQTPQQIQTEMQIANSTDAQDKRIDDLLNMMRMVYLAENPLEAINEAGILPLNIQAENWLGEDTVNKIGMLIGGNREKIRDTARRLAWDHGDAIFSRGPIAIQITTQINTLNPSILIQYDPKLDKILIGEKAKFLKENVFVAKLLEEFRIAEVTGMARVLRKILNTDEEGQRQLEAEMNAIVKEGGSLSQFILIFNMKDRMNFEDTLSLLKDIRTNGEFSEDQLEDYIGQSQVKIEAAIAREYETSPSNILVRTFRKVGEYLRQHPAVAVIPLAFFMLANGVHNTALGADLPLSHPETSMESVHQIQAHVTPVASVTPVSSQHILKQAGPITKEDQQDIDNIKKIIPQDKLKGYLEELNTTSNYKSQEQYHVPVQYMLDHWSGAYKGPAVTHVDENGIILVQHILKIQEDGRLGPQTRQALADAVRGAVAPQGAFPGAGAPPPLLPAHLENLAGLPMLTRTHVIPVMSSGPQPLIAIQAPALIHNKPIFTYPTKLLQPTPVYNDAVSKINGDIILNQQKNINKGDTIATFVDKHNKSDIKTLSKNVEDQEATLKLYEAGLQDGSSSGLKVVQAKLKLLELKMQLAQARAIEKLHVIKAPYNLTVRDTDVRDGQAIRSGVKLLSYYDSDRLRFDIVVPRSIYFENMAVTLDGKPVESSFWFKESPTIDLNNVYLGVIVTPQSQVDQDKPLKFSAVFYAPDKGPNMPNFKGRANTSIPVGKIKEYVTPSPETASYEFKVHQGDKVKKGQLLAQGDTQPFELQLEYKLTQIEGIDIQLSRTTAPDGTVIITKPEVDKLKADREKLSNDADELREQIARLNVRADEDGTISWSAQNASDVLQYGDDLFRINNDTVLLGDLNDTSYSILFPKGVKVGNMVEGMTPAGPVFGVVTAVDPTPHDSTLGISSVNSVHVTMKDPDHFVRSGMQLPLKLLTDQEASLAAGILKGKSVLPTGKGSPPPDPLAGFASGLFVNNTVGQFITPAAPQVYYQPQGPTSLLQIVQEVSDNQQKLLAPQYYDVMQKRVDELQAKAKKFSIFGSLYVQKNGGKLGISGFGGASGVVNGVTSALTSGGLVNYGFSIFGQVLGNVIDLIDGKIGKEVARDHAWTKSSEYSFQTTLSQQINTAKVLYTHLGAIQQGIAQSRALMGVLQEEKREVLAAESHKLIAHPQVLEINGKILDLQGQIQKMEGEEKTLTASLNDLRGQKIVDGPRIIAELTLTGVFSTITDDQKHQWLSELTGPNSKDPRLLKARADLDVVMAEMKVQGLNKLPFLTVGSLIPNASISTLPYEPYGSGAIERGSSITGPSGLVQAGFDVVNQKTKIESKLLAIQKKEAEDEIDQIKRDLEKELDQAVNNINTLSEGIETADKTYQNDYKTWAIPASQPGVFVPYEYDAQRRQLTTDSIKTDGLKRDYLEQEETFKKMGIDETLIKTNAGTRDRAQLVRSSFLRKFVFAFVSLIALAVGPLTAQDERVVTPPLGVTNSILANRNPTNAIAGTLGDSNPLNRMQALELIKDLPNTMDSIDAFEKIVMSSSPEIRQEIFRLMVERQDLHFLIQVIDKVDGHEDKRDVLNRSYQAIGDILTDHSKLLDTLRPSSSTATVNYADQTDITLKVFLNFIAQNPKGIGQTNLLLSNYWRTDELAHIHNNLGSYLPNLNGKQIKDLKDLFKDAGTRKIFLETNKGHFTPGEIQNTSSYSLVLFDDNIARAKLKELPADYEKFYQSPNWQEMGKLRPDLVAVAQQAFQSLIDQDRKLYPVEASNVHPKDIPDLLPPQDSMALLGMMDYNGQKQHIAQAKNSELVRILEFPAVLRSPLLLNDVFNRLMADSDVRNTDVNEGRIRIFNVYIHSSDKEFRQLVEAQVLDKIDTIKQDAKVVMNPAAMGIFREGLRQMYNQTHLSWLIKTYWDTFSSIELSQFKASSIGPRSTRAQVNLVATRVALTALTEQYPELAEKDMFLAGRTVYSTTKNDTLHRVAEYVETLNDPEALDSYLKVQAARSLEDKTTIDELISYRDILAGDIETNNQEITNGPWWKKLFEWQFRTSFYVPISLIVFGFLYTVLPKFQDWRKRKFSSLEHLMELLEKDFINAENRGEDPEEINQSRVEPAVRGLLDEWNNKLKVWSSNRQYPAQSLLDDQERIIEIANDMIKAMPYTPELMNSETGEYKNQLYQDTDSYFVLKANKMSKILSNRFKNDGLNKAQKEQFLAGNEKMLLKMVYIEKYLDILQDRANVNTGLNEQFSKKDLKEKPNVVTTWSLGYRHLVRKPQKNLERDIRDLMGIGNLIIPGLYPDIEGVVRESKERLKEVIAKGKRLLSFGNAASRENTRVSSWVRRLAFLIPSAAYFFKSIYGMMGFAHVNWFEFVVSIGGLAFSFSSYWSPIMSNLRLSENRKMKEIMIRLHNNAEVTFNGGQKVKNWKELKNKVVQEAVRVNQGYANQVRTNLRYTNFAMNSSSPDRSRGGIDLNFKPQYVRQSSRPYPQSINEAGFHDMPDGFKGFNFNIIRFTSALTVNGAFHLMFNSN